ncbi:MAG TPA: flagellar basal body-associated FliL family protein [Holophaga sp.]|nr:flagellar basal body-associated FliL family protein [Holophaga sp.]
MADDEAPKGRPLKKLILMGGLGLIVLGALGGGGFFAYKKFFAKKGDAAAAAETAKTEEPPEAEEDPDAPPPAVMVYRNIVNLDRKNAYLKVELHLLFSDPELGKAATSDKPTPENSQIRALLLEVISGKTLEEVTDPELRESLRQEVKDRLNERFAPRPDPKAKKAPKPPVKEVLVVDWAISA